MEIIETFIGLVPITLSQSLIYAFVALGVMVPFRILNFPDLTAEGSFPLGGCIFAASMLLGFSPFVALLIAVSCGFLAGCTTAFIHLKFKINTLLSGILVLTMVYSVNLRAMGRSNVALFSYDNIFTLVSPEITENLSLQILFLAVIIGLVAGLLYWLLKTQHGLSMRAVGSNDIMAASQGVGVWVYTIVGLGIANAMTALGGAVLVQSQGFADANMGFGILINGLAALIITHNDAGTINGTRDRLLRLKFANHIFSHEFALFIRVVEFLMVIRIIHAHNPASVAGNISGADIMEARNAFRIPDKLKHVFCTDLIIVADRFGVGF